MKTFTEILKDLKNSEGYKYLVSLASHGVYSHDGLQHADNILAACFLKKIEVINKFDDIKTVPRDEHHPGALVFDYDSGEFDHHGSVKKTFLHDGVEVPHCAFTLLCAKIGIRLDDLTGIAIRDNMGPAACPDSLGAMIKTIQSVENFHLTSLCTSIYPFFSVWFESYVRLPVYIGDLRKKYGNSKYCLVTRGFPSMYLKDTLCEFVISKQTDGYACSVVPGNSISLTASDIEQKFPDLLYVSNFMVKFKTRRSAISFVEEVIQI